MSDSTTQIAYNRARVQGKFPVRHLDQWQKLHAQMFDTGEIWRTPAQQSAGKAIKSRCKDGETSILHGPPGTGKTLLLVDIAMQWFYWRGDSGPFLRAGYTAHEMHTVPHGKARYWTLAGLLSEHKETFGKADVVPSPLKRARECGLLVLDDITPQNDSGFDLREIRDLIDYRYSNKRPTILATNINIAELGSVLDEPTIDRLMDGGLGAFSLAGDSMRGVAK